MFFWVNSCCRATSQDPASLCLTVNSTPVARQGNNSWRCRDMDRTHDKSMLSLTHPFKNHCGMDRMSANILLNLLPVEGLAVYVWHPLVATYNLVFLLCSLKINILCLSLLHLSNVSAATMEKVQASSISNNSGSLMSQWKCGLYTFCKGRIQQLIKTWRKTLRGEHTKVTTKVIEMVDFY